METLAVKSNLGVVFGEGRERLISLFIYAYQYAGASLSPTQRTSNNHESLLYSLFTQPPSGFFGMIGNDEVRAGALDTG